MIGSLRGRIASKTPPQLTVDVGGLGYELEAPMSTFFHLPPVGEEGRLFRSLIKVSGVGPKIALALLSGISVAAFAECVQREDISALTRIPGVGRKTAERLIVEMRDRLMAPPPGSGTTAVAGALTAESEAYDALVALGYRPAEATRLLKAVTPGTHSTEELIRRALQGAARESNP